MFLLRFCSYKANTKAEYFISLRFLFIQTISLFHITLCVRIQGGKNPMKDVWKYSYPRTDSDRLVVSVLDSVWTRVLWRIWTSPSPSELYSLGCNPPSTFPWSKNNNRSFILISTKHSGEPSRIFWLLISDSINIPPGLIRSCLVIFKIDKVNSIQFLSSFLNRC